MNDRERLLAIMGGGTPDRIPWIPRLQIWHTAHTRLGTLPESLRGLSRRQIEATLGMGDPARDGRVFAAEQTGDVEVSQRQEGPLTVTTCRTPVGTVRSASRTSTELEALGIGALEVEHMVKQPGDLAVVEYLVEHTHYRPTYEEYHAYEAAVGEHGYPMVSAGDCPFHYFLQKLAGYQQAYYLIADCPDEVEHLLTTMEEVEREYLWPVVAGSPAQLILHGYHFDSTLTPPPYFSRYITPYYRDFADLLHQHGKTLAMHADNDSRLILEHIEAAGFDMAETFTTWPQVHCTLEEARRAWGNRVIIWGGVPSVMLEPAYSDAAFEDYMRRLFSAIAPGDAFILGVADNIMPAAMLSRLQRIGEMVADWGRYPVHGAALAG
jgi:uroporphyrinogen-III decarboxylase